MSSCGAKVVPVRSKLKPAGTTPPKGKGTIMAGIDVGSLYTKTVLTDVEGKVLSYSITRSGSIFRTAADDSLAEAMGKAGIKFEDICYLVSTGYGRHMLPFTNEEVTELTCHAEGARKLFPEVHTVVDIGGQDSKVVQIGEQSEVVNFVMNDKCAAGTGRFLEVMAATFDTDVARLSELYFQSKHIVNVTSMCTVFAETEVISLLVEGNERADIAAGLFRAIARRIAALVGQIGLRERVVMSGGVAKSAAMVNALGKALGVTILVPEEPQIVGAFGAALIAAKRSRRSK